MIKLTDSKEFSIISKLGLAKIKNPNFADFEYLGELYAVKYE